MISNEVLGFPVESMFELFELMVWARKLAYLDFLMIFMDVDNIKLMGIYSQTDKYNGMG
jgi:hypothetical protein